MCLTYWLNALQNLGDVPFAADASAQPPPPVLVTLNPPEAPRHVVAQWRAAHPVPSRAAAAAKRRLPTIQGADGGALFFAGAYAGCACVRDTHARCIRADVGAVACRLAR